MNDQQPELLEQFLQALRQNPHALAPDGLEPEIAEFARRFMQQTPSPTLNARRRMWENALSQSRISANGHLDHKELNTMSVITARPETTPPTHTRYPLTLLAAGFAALLFVAIYMLLPKGTPTLSALGAPNQQQDATFTPIPSLVPTSTPSPAGIRSMNIGDLGDIYRLPIPLGNMLTMMGIDGQTVQNVRVLYQITLNDGTLAFVSIQSIPDGTDATTILQSTYPTAQVSASDIADDNGRTFTVLSLSNGAMVYLDSLTPTMITLTTSQVGIAYAGTVASDDAVPSPATVPMDVTVTPVPMITYDPNSVMPTPAPVATRSDVLVAPADVNAVWFSGTIYVPVIGASNAAIQAQAQNDYHLVTTTDLVYQVSFINGSVVYVEAQTPPDLANSTMTLAQLFPDATIIYATQGEYYPYPEPVQLITLSNGFVVIASVETGQILTMFTSDFPSSAGVSSGDGTVPAIAVPISATMLPTIPPAGNLIATATPWIVTATPTAALVITVTPLSTAMPPTVVP